MANVYIEARPKGRPEGSPIDDYVVEDHNDRVRGTFNTQREAIDWAKAKGHAPLVARVRHLNDKKGLTIGERANLNTCLYLRQPPYAPPAFSLEANTQNDGRQILAQFFGG
jgi:hypothetical protein